MAVLRSLDPRELVDRTRREAERNALRARNGIKLAVGLDRPKVAQTPKDVVWRRDRCELWRYRNDRVGYSPPLFIVFSLVSRSYILDLAPGNSFIERLRDAGFDVFLLDWGITDERDAGNTLEDYCDSYIPAAVERALEISGCDEINMLGYCFGGDLALLSVAHNRDLPVRSLTTIATPVDMTEIGLYGALFREGRLTVDEVVDNTGNIPPNVIKQSFRVLKPTQEVGKYANLLDNLWNDQVHVRLPDDDPVDGRPRPVPRRHGAADGGHAAEAQRPGHRRAHPGRGQGLTVRDHLPGPQRRRDARPHRPAALRPTADRSRRVEGP